MFDTGGGLQSPDAGNGSPELDPAKEDQMAALWDYPSGVTFVGRDIVGYDVEAADGGIGKIDESSHEAGGSYVVVDTGFWIFGKKRMIPAGAVTRVDHPNNKVHIGLTKEQIKSAPDFDEQHRDTRDVHDRYFATALDVIDPYVTQKPAGSDSASPDVPR
jgi:hypothetical protein